MPSSGEIDITNPNPTGEPQPGTPEFGARAAQRIGNIAAPAPGDEATPAERGEVVRQDEWSAPEPASGTATPGAQPSLDTNLLGDYDIPVPVLDAFLTDPNPPNAADPEGDIVRRLTESLLADPAPIPQPRGLTGGEHIALGIIGALDPEAFQSVVLPMLQQERNAPRQAALDLEAQKKSRIAALQSLATLMESRRGHEAGQSQDWAERMLAHREQQQSLRQAALAGNAQRHAMIDAARIREQQKAVAKTKIPDRIMGTYTLAVIAHQDAMAMKKLLDNNTDSMGGAPGGPFAGRLGGFGPGGDVRAKIAALAGTVNESIMMITQRRGLNKESVKKLGGSLPDITQSSETLRKAVETAVRTTGQLITGTEVIYPTTSSMKAKMIQLLAKSGGDPDAISTIVQDPESWLHSNGLGEVVAPGAENGDTDMNLWLDDDEVK